MIFPRCAKGLGPVNVTPFPDALRRLAALTLRAASGHLLRPFGILTASSGGSFHQGRGTVFIRVHGWAFAVDPAFF